MSIRYLKRTALLSWIPLSGALVCGFAAHAQTGSGGKEGSIEKCERSLGTLAVAEPQSHVLASLSQHKLGSPSTMLRMIAQESGCFTVVERGLAMQNIQQERALAAGGLLQQDANVGAGQLQAADFVLTPSLQFSDSTGGLGATVGGLLGRMGGALGALGGLAGGLNFKAAETTLLLADVRSGIQVASAEGQASKMDFSLGGWGWGGFGWASAGGYSKTPEGKLLAASLLDNFNRIVQQVRNKPSLVQSSSAASRANSQASTAALMPQGQALTPATGSSTGTQSGFENLLQRAAGTYEGQLSGVLAGAVTLHLSPDGGLHGTVPLAGQPALKMVGQLNGQQGDFTLSGNHPQGNVMAMGKLDLFRFTMAGNWFLSKTPHTAPQPGGSFALRR